MASLVILIALDWNVSIGDHQIIVGFERARLMPMELVQTDAKNACSSIRSLLACRDFVTALTLSMWTLLLSHKKLSLVSTRVLAPLSWTTWYVSSISPGGSKNVQDQLLMITPLHRLLRLRHT